MTAFSALSPVSAALLTALNVPAFTAVALGGAHDDVPQGPTFPFLLFEVDEHFTGGMGTRRGVNDAYQVSIRLHVYSQYRGWKEAQAILAKALELLATPPVVSGFNSWAIFWDDTVPASDQLIAGVKCKELVQNGRLYVEVQ